MAYAPPRTTLRGPKYKKDRDNKIVKDADGNAVKVKQTEKELPGRWKGVVKVGKSQSEQVFLESRSSARWHLQTQI